MDKPIPADKDTYEAPKDGWVCFHCGERFTTPGSARDHFGTYPDREPACVIKAGDERGLVMALRKAEDRATELFQQLEKERRENEIQLEQFRGHNPTPQNAEALEKMVKALKMVVHNAAIRAGKKGKAWDGDFVNKQCQSALTEYLAAQDGRCPDCGYTEEDKKLHGDHRLCPRAALEGVPEGWQDISTAPRDGAEILGFMPSYYQGKGGMKTLCWMNFSDRPGWYGGIAEPHEPTHWMPLPAAPKKGGVV